jgi:integrase
MKLRPKVLIRERTNRRVTIRISPRKSAKRWKEKWPLIRKRRNPSGRISFMVDPGMRNGERPRKFFKTKGEAETYAELLKVARKNEGDAAFDLPQKLRIDALDAQKQLAAVGATLNDAVRFFLKHAAPRGGKKLLADAIAELLESKKRAGRKESYTSTLGFVLKAFSREFPESYINEIGRHDIETWLNSNFPNLITRRNRIRDLSILFTFAVKRGYAGSNPFDEIERPTITIKRPEIFSVSEAVALLRAAEENPGLELLGFLSIALFAGLRTSELMKLNWKDVSLEHGVIDVSEEIAKTRQQRNVEINDTLRGWLDIYAESKGPVVPKRFRDRRLALQEFAKVPKWPRNGLRHSFGSYHVARFQNPNSTALQMGHNSTDVLFKHYRNYRIRPKDAEKYWNLRPDSAMTQKIIALRSAA